MAFAVGQLVKAKVKGVTNDRVYTVAGRVLSLHGPILVIWHSQPWSNFMRETPVRTEDVRPLKPRNLAYYEFLNGHPSLPPLSPLPPVKP